MSLEPITPAARQFVAQHIQTVEQLEIILTLGGNEALTWTAHQVFQKIQSNEKSIHDCLLHFQSRGLLTMEERGVFRLAPAQAGVAEILNELGAAYRERHLTVIDLIYRKAAGQVQNFAEAFRIRKEK